MHVGIIGAGMGGLAAAIHLATAGVAVTVFEQGRQTGGKLNRWRRDGWTFDTGPSLLTMPWVLRELFADAGASLDDALALDAVDPICRYIFADGSQLDVTTNTARMAENIAAIAPQEVPAFFRFLAYAGDLYALAGEPFLRSPVGREMFRRRDTLFRYGFRLRDLGKVLAPRTVHGAVSHFFTDPRLRQVFDRYATYNGSSPYRAPAAFCLIPFVELSTGAWHPRGGMYRVAEALTALARTRGAAIHLDAAVAQVMTRNGRAVGVRLGSGEEVATDAIVSNVDVLTTYERLLASDPAARAERDRLRRLEPSYSGFVLLLGTRRTYPHLPHHTIFFSEDYRAEFDDLLTRRIPPAEPTIYVCRATATDPSAAPPGCDNLFVMVNVPYLNEQTDWRALAPAHRNHVLASLRRRGLAIDERDIVVEDVWTPERLAQAYSAQRGAIYGFASNDRRAAFLRPPNRARAVRGLYFAGGSTHPGGGVPLTLLSGRIAADLVREQFMERAA